MREKERVFGEEGGKMNLRGRESVKMYSKGKKKDLICLYL